MCDHLCVCPPSPELEDQIIKAKQALIDGATPNQATKGTLLNARSLPLILGRPKQTRAHTLVSPTRQFAPVTGSRKVIVLLVDFSDEVATTSQAHYNDLLFSTGSFATGSMRDFYREASYGKLDVTGTVSGTGGVTVGWYRAAQPKSHYTASNFGLNTSGPNAPKLVSEIITQANPHVNFAPFDNDGDSHVEAVVIIAAGSGGEQTVARSRIGQTARAMTRESIVDLAPEALITAQAEYVGDEHGGLFHLTGIIRADKTQGEPPML